MGASNVLLARSRNWKPPGPPDDKPIATNALLTVESTTTPQFVHVPPEKFCVEVAPLVTVLLRVVPLIRKTSVLLPVHTVVPVVELDEQEFGTLPVTTVVGAPPVPTPLLVSIGTTLTAAVPPPQLPCGAYTVALVLWTSTAKELDGKHAFGGADVGVAVGVGFL